MTVAATADIWSTVSNFHSGDAATVFGVTQADFNLKLGRWTGRNRVYRLNAACDRSRKADRFPDAGGLYHRGPDRRQADYQLRHDGGDRGCACQHLYVHPCQLISILTIA